MDEGLDREAVVRDLTCPQVHPLNVEDEGRVFGKLDDDTCDLNVLILPEELSRVHGPIKVDVCEVVGAKH